MEAEFLPLTRDKLTMSKAGNTPTKYQQNGEKDEYGLSIRERLALKAQLHSGHGNTSFRNPVKVLQDLKEKNKPKPNKIEEGSEKEELETEPDSKVQDRVAVFNANSVEGSSIVRGLAQNGAVIVNILDIPSRNLFTL